MSSPQRMAETAVVIFALLIVRLLIIRLPIPVLLVGHDVVVIMMNHVGIAVFVLVRMMIIVMDDIRAVAAIDRGDSVLIIAPFIVGSCAGRAEE